MTKRINSKRIYDSPMFVVDADYLRDQARDAVRTFLPPLSGVYFAATGSEPVEPDHKKRA